MPIQTAGDGTIVATSRLPSGRARRDLERYLNSRVSYQVSSFRKVQAMLEEMYPNFFPWGENLNPPFDVHPRGKPYPVREYRSILFSAIQREDTKRIKLDCEKYVASIEVGYVDDRSPLRGQINSVLGRAVILELGMISNSDCVRIFELVDASMEMEFEYDETNLRFVFQNKKSVDSVMLEKVNSNR